MEFIIAFLYDVIGIKAIHKEKSFTKKLMMIWCFPIVGLLLIMIYLLI